MPRYLDASSYTVALGTTQNISAYTAGTHASWANEGAQEYSVNNGQLFGLSNYTDTSDAGLAASPRYNFADAATAAWDTAQHTLTDDGAHHPTYDPQAATSGYSGREYLAAMYKNGRVCDGMTSTNSLDGSWDETMECVNFADAGEIMDSPSMRYDPGGTTAWNSAHESGMGTGIYLSKRDNCTGSIGSGTCPVPFDLVRNIGTIGDAHRVVVNRCGPGVFMALRKPSGSTTKVSLAQFDPDGVLSSCVAEADEPMKPNDNCAPDARSCSGTDSDNVCPCGANALPDCTGQSDAGTPGGPTCWRVPIQPNIAMKATTDGHCYVYVAWDASGLDDAGDTRLHAKFERFDVSAGLPTDVMGNCNHDVKLIAEYQTFESVIQVSETSTNVGWFYYKDQNTPDDHCSTHYWGEVDQKLDFSTRTAVDISGGGFPNLVTPMADGNGDVTAPSTLGLPGGILLPSWAGPVTTTSAEATYCNGNKYDTRDRGRTIQLKH
jgi:hypothetical protein